MKLLEQFNVRIRKTLKRRVAIDKANTSVPQDIIAEVALEDFFTRYTPDQRAKFYRNHDRRAYARAA